MAALPQLCLEFVLSAAWQRDRVVSLQFSNTNHMKPNGLILHRIRLSARFVRAYLPGHFPLSLISGRRALGMEGKVKSESQNLTNKKRGKRYEKN